MTVRGGYGIFYEPAYPERLVGCALGQQAGLHGRRIRSIAFAEYPGVQLGQRVQRSRESADARSFGCLSIWGPVSWDPDGGRVGYTQQWNFNIQRELPAASFWTSATSEPRAPV